MLFKYMVSQIRSVWNGSMPMIDWPSPWQMRWDTGESMMALTTQGAESTSP